MDELEKRPHIDWGISLGALLQAAVVSCGLIAWFTTSNSRSEQTQRDVAQLQRTVSGQLADMRTTLTGGIDDIRKQIATLPDQRARLDQVERRLGDLDKRLDSYETRISALERQAAEARADLNNITRASGVNLGRR